MAKLSFNAKKAEPMVERKLVSEGEHIFSVIKSEIVPNSKKTADRLNFQMKVLNGEEKGSIVYVGLNWNHPNPVAQNISDSEFKSICDAVGHGDEEIDDTEILHGIPFIGTVKHTPPSEPYEENGETKYKYGPKAEIKKYAVADDAAMEEFNESSAETEAETSKKKIPWAE